MRAFASTAVLGGMLILGSPTAATAAPAAADCPAGDLLAGRLPTAARPLADGAARMTDGRVAADGTPWDAPAAFELGSADAVLTWDLGAVRELAGWVLQGDADERFPLSGSLDGRTFVPLAEIAALPDRTGLATRTELLAAPVAVRYLRLEEPMGDGRTSIAELAAYCALPSPWPPTFAVEISPPPERHPFDFWNDRTSRVWELALALAATLLLALEARRGRRGETATRGGRRPLYLAALAVAILTYFNFGAFHFGNWVHTWDTLHYHLGAKYFHELSYDRLYECITVADSREPRLARAVERRAITDLRTNVLGSTAAILAHPERCTAHFSPARWRAFAADVAYFRGRETPRRWEEISTDHGFNGTPVWLLAGSALANLAPAGDGSILALTLLDPLYFLALVAVLGWAFGLRPLAVSLLVLATFFPCRFFWTGGAFLRWDWLFYTAAAVACLKKGKPWLGGMALGYAALLRIFPGLLAAGPAAAVAALVGGEVRDAWKARDGGLTAALRTGIARGLERPAVRAQLRFLGGAALAAALLVPASLAVVGGLDGYRAFLANTRKHQATPLTNHMGLKTVVSYRPSEVGRHLVGEAPTAAADPWLRWKSARLAAWRQARPAALVLAAAALVLLGRAARRRPEPWIAAALGVLFLPFAVELTSYYYAFLLVPALLWTEKRSAGIALLLLSAFSQLVSLGPWLGLPTWRDEQYTLISLATLAVCGGILLAFALEKEEGPLPRRKAGGREPGKARGFGRPGSAAAGLEGLRVLDRQRRLAQEVGVLLGQAGVGVGHPQGEVDVGGGGEEDPVGRARREAAGVEHLDQDLGVVGAEEPDGRRVAAGERHHRAAAGQPAGGAVGGLEGEAGPLGAAGGAARHARRGRAVVVEDGRRSRCRGRDRAPRRRSGSTAAG